MIETKARERGLAFPHDYPIDEFPQSMIELMAEQKMALAEAEERLEQRQREWEAIVQALQDNSMAVFRAMGRFRHESEPEQVERVLTSFEGGRFLIDRRWAPKIVSTRTLLLCCSISDGGSGTSTAQGRRRSC